MDGGDEEYNVDNGNDNAAIDYYNSHNYSLLEESSQLSGDALEYLSHLSDEAQQCDNTTIFLSDEGVRSAADFGFNQNFSSPPNVSSLPLEYPFENDLESELFGSILGPCNAIKGKDVMLSTRADDDEEE